MEITPGRAMYRPDEELKPLRLPKTYHAEAAARSSTLSINAVEFVPSQPNSNVQDRIQKIQRPHLQQQQQQSQTHQLQQQQQQQYQSLQHINAQMSPVGSSSVQDRLLRTENRGVEGGNCYYQQQQRQQQQRGNQQDYHHNSHHFNKTHNNHQHHHQHNNHSHNHSQRQNNFNNEHNNHQQQQQQQHQQQYHQQQSSSNASALAESANEMENIALDYLQTVIQRLNQNPGQFDSIATRFNYIFEGMESNHFVLSIAMEDIFDESIRNSNFRYMGAKLYSLLHTLNPSKDSLFHTMLKYKLDFHQQEVREYIQKKQEAKVRETALFLAELYMQLRGEDSRNNLIAENIVFSLKELLSLEDNKDNLRCICLTLKLAGYDLSNDCPNDMRDIITKLDAINHKNPGKYPLANNVIALQKNNWGRKTNGAAAATEAQTHTPPQAQTLRVSDDPVFYGPDGHEITAEECEFLTNGAAYMANSSDNDEDDELDNDDEAGLNLDPEMDEETERDYKMFLKQANNTS